MKTRALLFLLALAGAVPGFGSTDDFQPVVTITLKDGGTLVGTVVREDETSVTLRTASGAELKLPREAIGSRELRGAETRPPASSPFSDPNESRLMFAPTGRPLGKGNGYFSDHYVLFPGFAYGLTKNLSVAGGVSVVPALGISEQVFYVSASSAWRLGDKASLALGGLYAGGPDEDIRGGAALFGVTTFGHSDRSLSLGVAWLAAREEEYVYSRRGELVESRSEWRFRDAPVVMVGGSLRVARNLSLVSESWLFLGKDFDLSQQPFGLSLRFFSGRISADVGFVLVADILDEGFPVPWLSFSYHFGPARRASARSSSATPSWVRTAARGAR
jgi:hypothetical protein